MVLWVNRIAHFSPSLASQAPAPTALQRGLIDGRAKARRALAGDSGPKAEGMKKARRMAGFCKGDGALT
jgi:hypothetical protein